jgi:hypothetical protein
MRALLCARVEGCGNIGVEEGVGVAREEERVDLIEERDEELAPPSVTLRGAVCATEGVGSGRFDDDSVEGSIDEVIMRF